MCSMVLLQGQLLVYVGFLGDESTANFGFMVVRTAPEDRKFANFAQKLNKSFEEPYTLVHA